MIHDQLEQFEVAMMCELLEVSRQGYYDWIDRPVSPLSLRRDETVAALRLAHVESNCLYGSPNLHQDLLEKGVKCCLNTVAKYMKEHGIVRNYLKTPTDADGDTTAGRRPVE